MCRLLHHARGLIAAGFWTKGTFATNGYSTRLGERPSLDERDPRATNFCVLGAINRSRIALGMGLQEYSDAARHLDNATRRFHDSARDNAPSFNDHETTTLDDVVELFDHAGKLACRAAR